MTIDIKLGKPQPKQKEFMLANKKYVAYGGARGGGKSWAVREKAKRLAIKMSDSSALSPPLSMVTIDSSSSAAWVYLPSR